MKRIILFIRANSRELRFFLHFMLLFVFFQVAVHFSYGFIKPLLVDRMHTLVSSKIIHVISPHDNVRVEGNIIRSNDVAIEIIRGCDGLDAIILVIAAVGALQSGLIAKLVGFGIGLTVMYLANLIRIIGLFYTVKLKPELFEGMHLYIGQTFIIFIGILFFMTWATLYVSPATAE